MSDVVCIPIDQLHAHPSNPRLDYPRDVFEALVVQMRERRFDEARPVIVRAIDEGYEILSGHNRVEAAREAGLREVPCVIRNLADLDAAMHLAEANIQRPLSKLEQGLHFLAVEAKGVSAKEYAAQFKIDSGNLSRYRGGAKLFRDLQDRLQPHHVAALRDKAEQLWEVSRAPEHRQFELVLDCIDQNWSVKKTREIVRDTLASILPSERQAAVSAELSHIADDVAAPSAMPAGEIAGVPTHAAPSAEAIPPLRVSPCEQPDTSREAVPAEAVGDNATIAELTMVVTNTLNDAWEVLNKVYDRVPAGELRDELDAHRDRLNDYIHDLDETFVAIETSY